jgi:tRNA(fMet)-specific endonuclease VapC
LKFLLDTNICVFLIRNKGMRVHEHIRGHRVGEIGISAITECELRFGADKSSAPEKNHLMLDRFFLTLPVLAFDSGCTREYGRIRAFLEKKGTPIGSLDMLIAAHALGMGLTLVTNNTREFSRVPSLRFEDWTKG